MTTVTKKRRWLPRISLRTFLIAVTLIGASIGWYIDRAERQRRAVKWVRENGGLVVYDYQFIKKEFSFNVRANTIYARPEEPNVPEWLVELVGIDYFSTVIAVLFVDRWKRPGDKWKLPVSDISRIGELSGVEYLVLDIRDGCDLEPINRLSGLKFLQLTGGRPMNAKSLRLPKGIEELSIICDFDCNILTLAKLTRLRKLRVEMDADDIYALTKLKSLERVEFWFEVGEIMPAVRRKFKESLPNCRVLDAVEIWIEVQRGRIKW